MYFATTSGKVMPQTLQRLQPLFEYGVFRDLLRMQLQLHPFRKPDAPHFFDIAGPRPESQPVQRVNDLLFRIKPLIEGTGRMTGPGKSNRRNSDCGNRNYLRASSTLYLHGAESVT